MPRNARRSLSGRDSVEARLSEAEALARVRDVKATTHAIQRDPADALFEVASDVDANMIRGR
jgi:hypothetical protein